MSLSFKVIRYSLELTESKHQLFERQFLANVADDGWELKMKTPLNTNESSFIYQIERLHCPENLLVSILGKDASDKYLLSQYMGSEDIVFLLDGERVDTLFTARFYAATTLANLKRLLDESQPMPLALSIYGPIDNKHCQLFAQKAFSTQSVRMNG
ncbi:hypothetical protein [Enterovibrio calviensis]|uniref:hypothetical protein n=1 Tax=Enterovibrio calviensis TaxID=91359 RepID=UPI0012DD889D|nr:hypothetical protein [Enterovibrio calviensis]